MKQWLVEFRRSWQDKTFICGMAIFALSYLLLAGLAIVVSPQLYTLIITVIAGWQVASWSWRLAPKVKSWIFKD
ncbi:MAG: hypothetical protein EBT86_11825 [Actinobacteria bacterium]|nr:hypothetical protein [Actinomycetota bacterium]